MSKTLMLEGLGGRSGERRTLDWQAQGSAEQMNPCKK